MTLPAVYGADSLTPIGAAPMVLRQVVHELLACYAELRRHLTHQLRNADDAADIAQSTFLQTYAHALAGPISNPRALVFQTARHLCIDQFRRQSTELAVLDAWFARTEALAPSAERVVGARQALRLLIERVEQMPPLRREVFVRVRVHAQTHREVAAALGLTAAAIEKHIARAVFDLSELAAAFLRGTEA